MDHSIAGYLRRRPTQVLLALQQQFARCDPEELTDPQLPLLVEQILAERANEQANET